VRYRSHRENALSPEYYCRGSRRQYEPRYCQSIPGALLDATLETLLLEKMSLQAIDVTFGVQEELQRRFTEADKLRYRAVEQALYERDAARKHYMCVDPENRLVADTLEGEWNQKIKDHHKAKEDYEKRREADRIILSEEKKAKCRELIQNFPQLWNSNTISTKDKKRLVHLIIADVTLKKEAQLSMQIRFKGGATSTLCLPLPKSSFMKKKHSKEVIAKIDALLEKNTDGQVAEKLNKEGLVSGTGKIFDARRVSKIRRAYKLKSYYFRLRQRGLKTIHELCDHFGVTRHEIYKWRNTQKLSAYRYDDVGRYLYEANFTQQA